MNDEATRHVSSAREEGFVRSICENCSDSDSDVAVIWFWWWIVLCLFWFTLLSIVLCFPSSIEFDWMIYFSSLKYGIAIFLFFFDCFFSMKFSRPYFPQFYINRLAVVLTNQSNLRPWKPPKVDSYRMSLITSLLYNRTEMKQKRSRSEFRSSFEWSHL